MKVLSSWDSAGKMQSITPKAQEHPRTDTKGKNWVEFKESLCLGKHLLLLFNSYTVGNVVSLHVDMLKKQSSA